MGVPKGCWRRAARDAAAGDGPGLDEARSEPWTRGGEYAWLLSPLPDGRLGQVIALAAIGLGLKLAHNLLNTAQAIELLARRGFYYTMARHQFRIDQDLQKAACSSLCNPSQPRSGVRM